MKVSIATRILKTFYECKCLGRLGPDPDDSKEIQVLNRTLRYVDGSDARIELEGDIRHSERIVDQLNLRKAKPVNTPAVKRSSSEVKEDKHSPKLDAPTTSLFRSVTMRAVY